MAILEIKLPKMGESIKEATVLNWLKQVGDAVEKDDPILEVATDKVDSEVAALESGVITELLFAENDVVPVGTVIAKMDTSGSGEVAAAGRPREGGCEANDGTIRRAISETARHDAVAVVTMGWCAACARATWTGRVHACCGGARADGGTQRGAMCGV